MVAVNPVLFGPSPLPSIRVACVLYRILWCWVDNVVVFFPCVCILNANPHFFHLIRIRVALEYMGQPGSVICSRGSQKWY
jgi:hypothetical protein